MERALNLIKTDYQEVEKRIFPRFPYHDLTFKDDHQNTKAFEVKDISMTGMQLNRRDGNHSYEVGNELKGNLHWKGAQLDIEGSVKWVNGTRLGVVFKTHSDLTTKLEDFLSIENIIAGMRPIHDCGLELEIPTNLKYWLRSDGPVEVFVWQHNDGELSRFQVILMNQFVEWEDGHGMRTGRVLSKRDVETPLSSEDEFEFVIDDQTDARKLKFAGSIIDQLTEKFLPINVRDFLKLKLGS